MAASTSTPVLAVRGAAKVQQQASGGGSGGGNGSHGGSANMNALATTAPGKDGGLDYLHTFHACLISRHVLIDPPPFW